MKLAHLVFGRFRVIVVFLATYKAFLINFSEYLSVFGSHVMFMTNWRKKYFILLRG
jgi:hypothetical protein